MKKIIANSLFAIRTLIVVLCVVCGAAPAWADHGGPHYARVTVTASPTGQGKVYMTTDKDYAPGSEDWQGSMSENWNCKDGIGPSEEDNRTYYVHAQAVSGYHFAKWSSNSSGTDGKSTANPYAYSTSASGSSGSPTANNIYAIFEANPQYTCTFLISTNGTYKYQYGESAEVTVTSEHSVTTDQNFTFTALPDPGYQVYGWYTESGGTKTYFDYSSYVLSSYALPGNIRIGVDFIPVGTPIFQIKGTTQMFTDLNAAVTACGNQTKTIVLVNNGTLLAGEYTIPSNVTLLIPFDAAYTCYTETPGTIDSYTSPTAYRTLTMSPGARLIVNGKISLSAKVSGLDVQGPNGVASGPYGAIKMLSEGDTKSTITLNNGGKLYCWGYIYGEGKVEALSGAEVHEGFNFMDFRGAQNTYDMNSDSHKVFPFNQYYIQNIEVPLTIHYGATEKVFSCLYPGGSEVKIPITMVGSSDGLFRLSGEGSKLTKWYDPHDDRQHYALEGNAAIRNISFTVTLIMSITVNSANFVLPITNNMDIEVREGATVDIAENICIMPDASITVEEGATLNIASGKNVYVYDKNAYTNAGTYATSQSNTYPDAGPGRYALGKYVRSVNYSPSWATIPDRAIRRLAIMHTARFKINGTLNATGKIYTTEGGADIYSDTDGAVINLSTAAGTATVTYQVDHHGYDAYYYSIPITSAQLHNADQSYAPTAGSPAGAAWTYKHGHWGWKVVWMLEDGTVLKTAYHYAQPDASWISSNAPSPSRGPEGTCTYVFNEWNTTTHTDNQEVTVVADYSKTCTNYYTVTWMSEDGTETLETDAGVGDGENTRYNGATPFKPFDTESSRLYTFDGWATEPDGERVYDIDGTPAASGDAIYYAHFAVTEVVAIVKADDDITYCTSIAEAFEVVRNTNFTPTIQVWKDASISALVYNIENYCTLDLNGHTLTSVTSSVQSPFRINKSNITFTITDSSESQSGKLSMTSTYGSPIFGLFVQNGNLQLNGGTIEVISGTATTFGVTANSNGSFIMNGGTIHVVTTNNKEGRGVYSAGTVIINDGTIHVEAAGVGYGIKRDGGTFAVNGGKFNINGSSSYINYGSDADANIAIKGGYYTTNSRLANVVPSPYLVYDWASPGEPYHYTVAAKVGYTVTFQNTDETTLQTGTWVEGTTPAYAGETPTKPGDTEGAWMFDHWTPDLATVTEDATYTAFYVPTPPVASVTISGTTTNYIHFDDAWTAANTATDASTLTLLQDVTVTSQLTYNNSNNKNCILDLNGHTLTSNTSERSPLQINNTNVTFTITDGTEEKAGKLSLNTSSSSTIFGAYAENGHLLLNGGTIEVTSSTATACGVTINKGTFTMEGGTIHVKTTNGKEGRGIYANSTTTVNGGTVHVEAAGNAYGVRHDAGTMTINDGKFTISGSTESYINYTDAADNKLIIKGGYYNIDTRLGTYVSNPYHIFDLTSGAEFDEGYRYKVAEAYNLTWTTDGELSGEGYTPAGLTAVGTPIVAPTSTKEGYVFAGWTPAVAAAMPSADTEYTAQWAVASVTIGETTTLYTTFADARSAVNSASAASTLKLLDDVDLTTGLEYTNASKNCTLDLNGHIISGSATPLLKIAQNGITFTITDLTEAKEGRIECNTSSGGQKWAVEVSLSTLRFEGGTIYAKNTQAGTLFIGIYSGASGVIEISGGNIHTVTTANNPTYGVLTFGTATISSGSIQVEAAGTGYAVEARNSKSNVTITGGDFYATGSSTACVRTEGSGASLTLQGGYYNTNTNLAPNCATNYHVFPNGDATYLYKVAEGYTVTFNANGHGSAPESQLIEKNTHATTPTAPTATGYTFGGWYKEAACTNEWDFASDVVTQATNLFAKWTAINYSISYDLAGGSVTSANPTSYTVESSAITLNNPTKANYVFAGWTGTDLASATINVTISEGSTGNRSYTATWTPAVASVTINEVTTYYTTFDAAWAAVNAATAASTLTLLQDITGLASSRTYSASHNLTLDLNGHTLSGSSAETSMFQVNCTGHTFTVTDGSANHDGKLSFSSGSGSTSHCVIVNNGTFVLEAGTIEATSSTASIGAVQVAGGAFTMNENGAVHAKYTGNANGNNSRLVHAKGGTTTINGGLIRLESTKDAIGVVYSSGNVTFNGGLFNISASGTAAVTNKDAQNSNLNIRGGYYSATNSTYFNPHVKTPYHIFSNSDATYIYRVAAAYTLTWTTDGDALTGNYTSGLTEPGTTIVAPNTPTKTGYTFYGWTPAVDAAMPSADTEYTAQWAVASVTINDATTLYTDFSSAWTAANGSTTYPATIKLLQDVTVSSQLTYNNTNTQNCTLDLNGYTLTSETDSQQPLHINRSGISFTITDGTVDKSGKLSLNTSFSSSAIFGAFVDNGTLLLNGGTIEVTSSTAATCGVTANSNGTFTMNGGTIYVKTTANNKEGRGVYSVGRVIINDGAIHVEAAGTAYGIKRDGGTVTVNDGKFHISASGSANVTNHANVVIKGGYYNIDTNLETYVASPYHVFPNDDAIYRYKVAEGHTLTWDLDGGEVSVAGTPAGYVAVGDPITAPTVSKTDYTFTGWSTEVAQTMPANDVTYTATWEYNGVACVTINGTTTYYMTIDAAFTAANASTTYEPTITLLKDAATTTTSMLSYTGAKNCTLNLNGHTLSSTTAQALLYINHPGITFTITDLTESKSGTLHLESTSIDNRWCVYVAKGNLQMDAGTVFLRSKANTYNEGIRIDPAASTFTMNGGKVHVETSDGKPARGIVSRGIAVINDGEIQVEASGIGYGIEARVSDDGNNIGNVTVNGGKFLVTGTTAACAYRSDARATLKLQGGYYNSDTDLATYTSAPYEVQETTAADKEAVGSEYNYKVVENEETGFSLDIVDWTASNLTINANGWTASGWPYTINDVEYAKETRAADRTLTIPYSGEAGADLVIKLQDKDENIISQHSYKIPFIGTTAGAGTEDTVYVNSGTLTISTNTTLGGLYVRPEASVEVTSGSLTVGKLVMRTLPWQAAAINGSFTATETWYTRIAPNKRTISGPYAPITYESASYYQFALPRNCTVALNEIQVSNAANTPYGNTWLLKRYDELSRAAKGAGTDNWVALNGNETIQGGVGYELFSNSNYYREFYFPLGAVNSASLGTTTAVRYDLGAAGEKHAGWNIVASPLMSVYDNRGADPETGLKVSWLLTDGSYDQGVPEYIYPAIPFSYQASEGQTVISFEGSSIVAAAPRRSMEEESVRKQWLHLDIKNANGVGDQTSILAHPTRYEETYKTGIDVAKQSFTASRPLLYSSHTYGEMAFAGVADSLIEQGIPLTLYSPIPQELTISLRENNWLERLEEVWLIDNQTGAQIDLIDSDYTFEANEGTTRGRLLLMGRFKAPNIATDIENTEATEGNSVKAQKLIIRDKLYIRINGQLYDATGKMVNDK